MTEYLQNDEAYVNQAYTKYNPLTGLYYNRAFFKEADEFIMSIEAGKYMMVAIDVENFRLFNKLHGRSDGDELLIHISDCLKAYQGLYGGVAGYLGGDNFGIVIPNDMEIINKLNSDILKGTEQYEDAMFFQSAFGICIINDVTMSAVSIYDCAIVALMKIKGNYANRISEYIPEMDEKIEEELKLLADIKVALKNDEFTFFIQPQCDISSGKIVGGESLVRWQHGDAMISPGVFIPVLEKRGFIEELDKYVWKKVCKWLRSWLDKGYEPVPISINVSRRDILSIDVPVYLKELMEEYELPPKLIKIEITESAYAESNDKIIKTVKQLRDASFLVMMDDFGSGYSSLNMLKSVAVDVLKMDMRFLEIDEKNEEKGISILESVINMARQMKIPIIVEGVETKQQESLLLRMGCRYTQGFYYFRPMPVEKFEQLIADKQNVDYSGIWCNQVERMHVREFLDENLFSDIMVNNIIGAAAFYDMYENQIEITRVNEQYFKMTGISSKDRDNKKIWNHVRDDDRQLLFSMFNQAYENPSGGSDGYIHYVRTDGVVLWVYMRVYFYREKDGHKLFYSSLTDLTHFHDNRMVDYAEFNSEVKELTDKQIDRLERYYGNLPCGYGVAKIIVGLDEKPYDFEILYANKELARTSGGDIGRLRYIANRTFTDRRDEFIQKAYAAAYKGVVSDIFVYSNLTGRYLVFTMYRYEYGYVSFMVRDVTHTQIYQNALNSIMSSYKEVYFVQFHDNYCRMLYPDESHLLERGNYEEVVNRHFKAGRIASHDEENVKQFLSFENLKNVLMNHDSAEYKYKRVYDGKEEWCLTTFIVSERENGVPKSAVATIRGIEALMREKEEAKRKQMAQSFMGMSDGFLVYSANTSEKIIFANPVILKIYGCKTIEEFREFIGTSFRDMVHPDDLERVEHEIWQQIKGSERGMDYVRYRIIRKDGQVRWIDDCGHLEDSGVGGDSKLFYVFITDITDTISEKEKNKLIALSKSYNN